MPRVVIKNKICKNCGGNEWYTYTNKSTGRISYQCVKYRKILDKNYSNKYYQNNKERFAKNAKKYRNTKRGKESLERARKKERDNLTDNYIRQCIYTNIYNTTGEKIVRKDIPEDVIKEYRQIQIAKREVRKLNKLKKNGTKETN